MILLVGATGRLGKAVAERLLEQGVPFRAACRNVSKAQWLVERGIEVLHLDVEKGDGLSKAITGATKVISCIHGLVGGSGSSIQKVDIRGQAALIDAASEAGLHRFVYISALGASRDHPSEFWRAKAQTEQHLKASGLDYVILRPSAFMDLYAHDLIGARAMLGKTVILLGKGETPRNLIAVANVADATMQALTRDDLLGQTIDIGGLDSPTEREIATLYAGLAGKRLKLRSLPPLALKTLAGALAPVHAGLGRLLRLPLQLEGRSDLLVDASSALDRLGIVPVRLHDFAKAKLRAAQPVTP